MTNDTSDVILSVECNEPEGKCIRNVRPLIFTIENLKRFWEVAKQFPTLYGREILDNPEEFIKIFLTEKEDGQYTSDGLFWVVDDFVGVFYITDIRFDLSDALVHYSFFDRRQHGRKQLVQEMIKYVMDKYKFERLSAEIPNYTGSVARHFAVDVGFIYEGKKRKAAHYKGDKFDVNLYGILPSEVKNNGPTQD